MVDPRVARLHDQGLVLVHRQDKRHEFAILLVELDLGMLGDQVLDGLGIIPLGSEDIGERVGDALGLGIDNQLA